MTNKSLRESFDPFKRPDLCLDIPVSQKSRVIIFSNSEYKSTPLSVTFTDIMTYLEWELNSPAFWLIDRKKNEEVVKKVLYSIKNDPSLKVKKHEMEFVTVDCNLKVSYDPSYSQEFSITLPSTHHHDFFFSLFREGTVDPSITHYDAYCKFFGSPASMGLGHLFPEVPHHIPQPKNVPCREGIWGSAVEDIVDEDYIEAYLKLPEWSGLNPIPVHEWRDEFAFQNGRDYTNRILEHFRKQGKIPPHKRKEIRL